MLNGSGVEPLELGEFEEPKHLADGCTQASGVEQEPRTPYAMPGPIGKTGGPDGGVEEQQRQQDDAEAARC